MAEKKKREEELQVSELPREEQRPLAGRAVRGRLDAQRMERQAQPTGYAGPTPAETLPAAAQPQVNSRADAEQALAGLSYQKSEEVLAAERALEEYAAQKPGDYQSSYQEKIDALLDEILNRGPFQYSFDADPLYQQYKDSAVRSARLAMQDTMANAAAGAGGYGSSYAVAAGSQAYQNSMAGLDGVLPQLYQAALDRWTAEENARRGRLSELTALEKNAQSAYEDAVRDYYTGLGYYTDAAESAYSRDYRAYADLREGLADLRDYYAGQEQQSVKNAQSRAEYELAVKKYEESIRQWEAEQAAAREKWQAQLAWQQSQFAQEMAYKQAQAARAAAGSSPAAGGTGGAAGGSAGQLGAAAVQIQRQVQQQAAALASRVGTNGLTQSQIAGQVRNMLRSYYQSGAITKAEANVIGKNWGVSL